MQFKSVHIFATNLLRLMVAMLMLSGVFAVQPAYAVGGATLYVQASGLTTGSCDSWANACDLQYALGAAVSGDQIWVAAGTYHPTSGADRTATFTLQSGIQVYGGFAGTESLLSQRDPQSNVTVLSGDIGTPSDTSDNSHHVVTVSFTSSLTRLDGFTITAGNTEGASQPLGGGMFNESGSPTLSNLVLTANSASYGGGMYNGNAHPTLMNVTFSNNSAGRGAGMDNLSSTPQLTNVVFSNNHASSQGGGMSNGSSSPALTNVTFSGNTAGVSSTGWGGGMSNVLNSDPVLKNVTFNGNSAITGGGGIYNSNDSNPTLKHVTLSGNSAGMYGGGISNFANTAPVTITNSIVYGNSIDEIYDDTGVAETVVTYSIVQGGYTGTGNLNADPLLGTLASNGGYTQTMAIPLNSPALDAADDTSCESTDQRGIARPQGLHCDMGAYEYADPTPPTVVSILRTSANPTTAASVGLTVNFSEDVTGVDAGDFSLTTSGVTGASVTNVAGSGATYTVTLNTGTGDGTLRLDVIDNDSIEDLLYNKLGGTGTGNGDFTSGEVYTIDKIADPPAATTLVTPSGNIGATYKPTYTWNEVSGGASGATWYYLWVNDPSGNLIHEWYQASAICGGGTCSATPSKRLNPGNYTWWVRTYNTQGYGPWSGSVNFTIPVPPPPGAVTLVSPNGTIHTTGPTYTWNAVSGATWYYLWVNGPSGNLIKTWYDAAGVCAASTCSVTPAVAHIAGNYTWWVQTYNPGGYGPWSSNMQFNVAKPGATTLVSPDGSIGTNKPTYTWNDVPGATYYYLWVNGPSGNVVKKWYTSGEAACNGTTCSVTPNITLTSGAYVWWVQTWNQAGYGPWSAFKSFNTP